MDSGITLKRERIGHSLERRIRGFVLVAVGIIFCACGIALDHVIMNALQAEFDRALLARTQTVAGLLEQDEEGVDFDFFAKAMPEFASGSEEYFELWVDGWTASHRSESLGSGYLPRLPGRTTATRLRDVRLREGKAVRLLQMDFLPQLDPSEELDLDTASRPEATLVVGRARGELDTRRHRLRVSIAVVLGSALVVVVLAVRSAVTRGLSPLRELRAQLARLNAKALSARVALTDNYVELAPLITQTNTLLTELEHAFGRERLFTVAAAHELKTPLAEIRSLAEVAARFADDRALTSEYLSDIADSVARLDKLLQQLLLLANLSHGDAVTTDESIDLAAMISVVWQRLKKATLARDLQLVVHENLNVLGNRTLVELMFSNLLGNVIAHSSEHAIATVTFHKESLDQASVTVTNPQIGLTDADIEHVFDQFWRKDPARRVDGHLGLGLSLVRSCCTALNLQCSAHLSDANLFTVRIEGFHVAGRAQSALREALITRNGGAMDIGGPAAESS